MPRFRKSATLKFLGSLRLSIVLLALLGGASGIATLVESRMGTPAAWELIYKASWFELIFAGLVINLLAMLIVRLPWRKRQSGFVTLHLGLIVIILGACQTRFGSFEGNMAIREGSETDYILSRSDYIQLGAGAESSFAEVRSYKSGPTGIVKEMTIADITYEVALEEYFLHFQERLIEGGGGQPLFKFATVGEEGMQRLRLAVGEPRAIKGVTVTLVGPLPEEPVECVEGPRLNLYYNTEGGLVGCAGTPVMLRTMGGGMHEETSEVICEPGDLFDVENMKLYMQDEFSFVPIEFLTSAILSAAATEDPTAPSGMRVVVRGPEGDEVEVNLIRGDRYKEISIGGNKLSLGYGPRRIDLPYSVELVDFQLFTYPGSGTPSGYESQVLLHDDEAGIHGRPVRIYMNHPLSYRGYKHFQHSYDPDRLGTILSVSHDPGKYLTYAGYLLLTLGLLVSLVTNLAISAERGADS
ncbi:MAG: cytochrome c biogenesis protein ResB [bacterium]|nr:cytochrome c biogenesis protein ResB [bacterium]